MTDTNGSHAGDVPRLRRRVSADDGSAFNDGAYSDTTSNDTGVIDELALLRDDVLIDALAKGVLPVEYRGDPLANALWAWREDVVKGPLEAAPSSAAQVDAQPVRRDWSWLRFSRFNMGRRLALGFAAAAAVGALSLGSVAAASSAEPGDTFWPLAKVMDGQRAQSLEAREDAFTNLHRAQSAAQHNNPETAREQLQAAMSDADKVRAKDGKQELALQLSKLQSQLKETKDSSRPDSSQRGSKPPDATGSSVPSPSASATEPPSSSSSPPPSPSGGPPSPSGTPSQTPSPSPTSVGSTTAAPDTSSPSYSHPLSHSA